MTPMILTPERRETPPFDPTGIADTAGSADQFWLALEQLQQEAISTKKAIKDLMLPVIKAVDKHPLRGVLADPVEAHATPFAPAGKPSGRLHQIERLIAWSLRDANFDPGANDRIERSWGS